MAVVQLLVASPQSSHVMVGRGVGKNAPILAGLLDYILSLNGIALNFAVTPAHVEGLS